MTNKPMIVSLYTIHALNYIWLQLFLLYSGGPHYCPDLNSIMEQFQVLSYISVNLFSQGYSPTISISLY